MEDFIKKLEERRAGLIKQSNESKDLAEVKSINQQLMTLNDDIAALRSAQNESANKPEDKKDNLTDEERMLANSTLIGTSANYVPGHGFIPANEGRNVSLDSELEKREKAGKDLREKREVKSPLSTFGELRTVTVTPASGESATIVVPSSFSSNINPDFPVVSSLVDAVAHLSLNGGEKFTQPYITGIDTGGYTTEGQDAHEAETHFDYVDIDKAKITAYAELTEELEKLPAAPYADIVFQNIRTSMRKLLTREILVGSGESNQLVGIFNAAKTKAIDANTDISISQITDTTLDEIVYQFGGDEEVEDPAVLILNKFDLLAFAKVRTSTKQKFYDIRISGNSGNINGVPFIINSACKSLVASDTVTGSYCMAYGPLSNYLLVEFSPMEVKYSDDFKFRAGVKAVRGNCFFGGQVVRKNGFLRIKKA